jgi:hypothetical protein
MRKIIVLMFVMFLLCGLSQAQASKHSVLLSWTPTQTQGVTITDFNVFRATTTGGPYTAIGHTASGITTNFTDSNVVAGGTYFYVVAAVAGSEQSADSNEAKAVVPQQPQAPQNLTATVK